MRYCGYLKGTFLEQAFETRTQVLWIWKGNGGRSKRQSTTPKPHPLIRLIPPDPHVEELLHVEVRRLHEREGVVLPLARDASAHVHAAEIHAPKVRERALRRAVRGRGQRPRRLHTPQSPRRALICNRSPAISLLAADLTDIPRPRQIGDEPHRPPEVRVRLGNFIVGGLVLEAVAQRLEADVQAHQVLRGFGVPADGGVSRGGDAQFGHGHHDGGQAHPLGEGDEVVV